MVYINKGNKAFAEVRSREYVDKSGMIAVVNSTLKTEFRYSCVTRCRRFGKSMAAKMLCAYYDESCDSRELFADLKIAQDPSFETYLNKFLVLYIDMTDFTTRYRNEPNIVRYIQEEVMDELQTVFPEVVAKERDDLMALLIKIHDLTDKKFVFIIDEWDAILREYDRNKDTIDDYVNLLRRLFKGSSSSEVFAGAYITGILPIKKYCTESALNNFCEYSMIDPGPLASFFGFTPDDVAALAERYNMNTDDLKMWYDGYKIGSESSMYNPYSVMNAMQRHSCKSYWQNTGAYFAVSTYIQMNFEGLKDDIIKMLAGGRCYVRTGSFDNDPRIIRQKNDVLTILIHLGYLGYDEDTEECYVPNLEVSKALELAIEDSNWTQLAKSLEASRQLLEDTLNGDEDAVARAIDIAHDENTSILSYNNENSQSCVLSIAYIWAKNYYVIHREFATGKGFADLVMIPRKNIDKPAMVIELKFNHSVDTAIDQIRRKQYPAGLQDYANNLLLVGISYDKEKKKHTCVIDN